VAQHSIVDDRETDDHRCGRDCFVAILSVRDVTLEYGDGTEHVDGDRAAVDSGSAASAAWIVTIVEAAL
jgi:hypothetical protein